MEQNRSTNIQNQTTDVPEQTAFDKKSYMDSDFNPNKKNKFNRDAFLT